MSHLRSPLAMIWPTLRAIEFPPWLATEAHNWRTLATSKHGYSDSLNRGRLIGRKSERRLSAADDLHGSDTQFAHRSSQIPFTCCGTMAYPRRTRGRAEW